MSRQSLRVSVFKLLCFASLTGKSVDAISCSDLSEGGFGEIIAVFGKTSSILKNLIIVVVEFC